MYYEQKNKDEKKVTQDQETHYTSQENAFIKYITQLDAIPHIIDTDFLKKYRRRVLFSGKIKGLSFINNPKTIQLNSCMRNNIALCEGAGLNDLADETTFDNIDICQVTRGSKGNLQLALITQRKEFRDTTEMEKKGFWGSFMRNKNKVESLDEGQIRTGY